MSLVIRKNRLYTTIIVLWPPQSLLSFVVAQGIPDPLAGLVELEDVGRDNGLLVEEAEGVAASAIQRRQHPKKASAGISTQ